MPHARFETSFGPCAIVWADTGLVRFCLPDPDLHLPPAEIAAPPSWVEAIMTRARRHLAGDMQDFADARYDFSHVSTFTHAVLRATLAVKAGCTATYGDLAAAIGLTATASRAVGAALGDNPWPLLIPCHRIVAANGGMGGYSGPGGIATKTRLLALEGALLATG